MNDMAALRRAVDQLPEGRLGPLLELLAEDVEFEVAGSRDVPKSRMRWGTQAVVDYFTALGALVAFWRIDYSAVGGQVIAWGKESFRIQGSGLEGECEFALVFDISNGRIVRFLVIEDLPSPPAARPAIPACTRRALPPPTLVPATGWSRARATGIPQA